jgi:hypothetical protein
LEEEKVRKIFILLIGVFLVGSVAAYSLQQNVRVEILPGELEVFLPNNGALYNDRMVPINISMNEPVRYFKYVDNGGRAKTLCRNCDEYGYSKLKRKPFGDGAHELEIIAIFETGEVSAYKNFIVDTKDPKIYKSYPKKGFANGSFEVEFKEANAVFSWLNYGNKLIGFREAEVNLENCVESRGKMKCGVDVDLSDYDLQEISYWFNVSDIIGGSDESKVLDLDVDVSAPVIEYFNLYEDGRYTYFEINVSEENFDEVNYVYVDSRGREKTKRLCSRLKEGICETKKRFREGEELLRVEVLDEAGNSISTLV